jgi:hypothetical protein
MTLLKRAFLLTVFLVCVGGGFLLAITLGAPGQARSLPEIQNPLQPGQDGVSANGQRNLLLVGVDSFEATNPRLTSVWLVLQIATNSPQRFTLLPLYPTPDSQALVAQEVLQASFGVDKSGAVLPGFFEAIHAADFWWANYVVLDQAGLAKMIDLGGGIDLGKGAESGDQTLRSLMSPQAGPDAVLHNQALVLQAICSQNAEHLLKLDAKHIFQLLGRHLRTDLEIERFIQEWQMPLIPAGRPSCEFPTLKASQIQIGAD